MSESLDLVLSRIEARADSVDVLELPHRVGVQLGLDMAGDIVRAAMSEERKP